MITTNLELAEAALNVAKNYKTLYVMGCFGAPMTDSNKKRYCNNHDYNKQPERQRMIMAADKNTFGFDCVNLIKGLLWGWTGDNTKAYGGAVYKSNGVPDTNANGMIQKCPGATTDFSTLEIGEALWIEGHIGVYVGDGLAVECTPRWTNNVQITAVFNLGKKSGYNGRTWTKHGKLPFVSYVKAPEPVKKSIEEIAQEVIDGKWGNGSDRKKALTAAGYDASAVQKKVNELVAAGQKPTEAVPTEPKKNDEIIWNFLKGKGLNDFAVAGVMGNLYAESALRPNNLQNKYEKSLGMTDDQYTKAVDNGTYNNFVKDSAGYGLAQWTYWSRKQALLNFAKKQKASIADLQMQLDYLWKELSGYSGVMKVLKNASSVRQASDAVLTGFEKPADQSEPVQKKRADYGMEFYDSYATEKDAKGSCGYMVKVTASVLNVRKGPGTNYPIVTTVKKGETYTIVGEVVSGSTHWGKLVSGAGWICLKYTVDM